jgi:hypothetical protein
MLDFHFGQGDDNIGGGKPSGGTGRKNRGEAYDIWHYQTIL